MVCWPAGTGTFNAGTSKNSSLEGRDSLGTCTVTTAAIKSSLMMDLNRHPEHNPIYVFDLANALSLWLCVLKGKCCCKKKKICTTSRNSQPLKLDLPEQAAVRKKPLLPPLLSLHGLFHLLSSFCLGPSWSFSESCVIAFDIFGLGLRHWSHWEEFNGLASRLGCSYLRWLLYPESSTSLFFPVFELQSQTRTLNTSFIIIQPVIRFSISSEFVFWPCSSLLCAFKRCLHISVVCRSVWRFMVSQWHFHKMIAKN